MAKWDITPNEAFAQLMAWVHAVTVTRDRIIDPDASSVTREVDAQLFAMAVRQVLRFANLCRAVAPKECWSPIDKAINAFATTSPDAISTRDVLDHWDEYLRGVGRDFSAGDAPGNQGIDRPTSIYSERGAGTYRLHIRPAPHAPELVLDVNRDADAATKLMYAIDDALSI